MAKPEAVTQAATAWNTETTPKETAEITVAKSDVLVACGIAEADVAHITIEGGGLTWTQQKKFETSNNCFLALWTATAGEAKSFKVKFTRSSGTTQHWGGGVQVWRKSSGVGAVAGSTNTEGAPSLAITTEKASSAIAWFNGDFAAKTGAATYRTGAGAFTEKNHVEDTGRFTVYGGYHAEAGAAGAYTVGMTAPTGQKYTIAAVEIKGEEGGKAWKVELSDTVTVSDSLVKGSVKSLADTASVSDAIAKASAKPLADTVSVADSVAKMTAKPLADSVTVADSLTKQPRKGLLDAVSVSDALSKEGRKGLSDSISVSDALAKQASKPLVDSIGVNDALAKQARKGLADSVSVSDSLAKRVVKTLADTVPVSDSLSKRAGKFLADSVAIADEVLARLIEKLVPLEQRPTELFLRDSGSVLALADPTSEVSLGDAEAGLVLNSSITDLALAESPADLGLVDIDAALELQDREADVKLNG